MQRTHSGRDSTGTTTLGLFLARCGDKGFTLIEVISVLLLMGILSAIAVSHSYNSGVEADVRGATEVVKGHLRYAQIKAMNSDLAWGISFNGDTYTMQNANTPADTVSLPGGVPQGMTFAASLASAPAVDANPVMFDNRWGIPVDDSNTPLNDNITVTVSKGGASQTITVTKNTGFIP